MGRYKAVPMEPASWGWCVLDSKTNQRDHGCTTEQSCIAEAAKRNAKIVREAMEQGSKALQLMHDALESMRDARGVDVVMACPKGGDHELVSARNEAIQSGLICTKCHGLFPEPYGVQAPFDVQAVARECGAFRFMHMVDRDPPSYTRFTDAQLAAFVERISTAGVKGLEDAKG